MDHITQPADAVIRIGVALAVDVGLLIGAMVAGQRRGVDELAARVAGVGDLTIVVEREDAAHDEP